MDLPLLLSYNKFLNIHMFREKFMDEINIIVGIIEKEFDVNRDIIKKSIRKKTF